jgi:hypothetical protein
MVRPGDVCETGGPPSPPLDWRARAGIVDDARSGGPIETDRGLSSLALIGTTPGMVAGMAERPDDDTIRLLREVLEEVGTNEAVASGGPLFGVQVHVEAGLMTTTYTEPPVKVLRHLLDRLRHLDMPTSDVRLDRVFPILERLPLKPDWRAELEVGRARYADGQRVRNISVQQPDEGPVEPPATPTWITPREAFRLWAYGGVVHHEYAKEQKVARLGIAQGSVRLMAHEYTTMLLSEADFILGLLRWGIEPE